MTDEADGLEAATRLLRSGAGVPAPAVEPLRAVVRSGEQFFLSDQGAPPFFVGSHVIEWGYEVAPERAAEFRNWLAANEAALDANAPPGVRYRGTFAVAFQSDLSLGSYRTIWTFAALADLAKIGAADPAMTFGRLVRELSAFRDQRIGASRSQQMYQPAASAERRGAPP